MERFIILVLYFSGTGNSKYISTQFAAKMRADCYSIEEQLDFTAKLRNTDTVCFCYPIYGSCVPRIMREFVRRHSAALADKKLIIFCTQMMFSGDGARGFTDLLPGCSERVIYAEHFNMPNNICNFWLFPIRDRERRCKLRAVKKSWSVSVRTLSRELSKSGDGADYPTYLDLAKAQGGLRLRRSTAHPFRRIPIATAAVLA